MNSKHTPKCGFGKATKFCLAAWLPALFFLLASSAEVNAAIATPTSIGTAATETAGTTMTISSVTAAAGNTIIVVFAMDPTSGTVGASDSAGNTYTLDKDIQNGTS